MRLTVTHNKGLQGAKKLVDDSAAELFKGPPGTPVQIADQQTRWEGDTMHYSFVAKMGFFSAPLKGWVQVTEKDVTIECELPDLLKKLIPEEKVKAGIETRVRGLLT
jgi:Putative polyhydroxyalkanoic acid system protein (PHA_gran_rgn)